MVSPSRCPPWQPERPGPTRREPRRAQRSYTTRRDTITEPLEKVPGGRIYTETHGLPTGSRPSATARKAAGLEAGGHGGRSDPGTQGAASAPALLLLPETRVAAFAGLADSAHGGVDSPTRPRVLPLSSVRETPSTAPRRPASSPTACPPRPMAGRAAVRQCSKVRGSVALSETGGRPLHAGRGREFGLPPGVRFLTLRGRSVPARPVIASAQTRTSPPTP